MPSIHELWLQVNQRSKSISRYTSGYKEGEPEFHLNIRELYRICVVQQAQIERLERVVQYVSNASGVGHAMNTHFITYPTFGDEPEDEDNPDLESMDEPFIVGVNK